MQTMGAFRVNLYDKSGRLRMLEKVWHVYAAFAVAPDGASAHVKIGISTLVVQRVAALKTGSPYPIQVALFCAAGDRRAASRIELAIHRSLADLRLSGEWFALNLVSPFVKARFHEAARAAFEEHSIHPFAWKKVEPDQVKAYQAIRKR